MSRKSNLAAYKLTPEKEHLVIKNIGLVKKVIQDRFSVYHEWWDDMLQEGTIGLIKAVAKHDASKGAQLSTFAYLCIKNEIQKFVSECTDTIRVPVSVGLAINGVRKIEENGGSEEDINNILEHNQVSLEMIDAGKTALATVSMDEENEDGLPYRDVLPGISMATFEASQSDKQMWSDIHNWFNFNFPSDYFDTRVYIDYAVLRSDGLHKINDIYDILSDTYLINRSFIRRIIPIYNDRLKVYLKQYSKNIDYRPTDI